MSALEARYRWLLHAYPAWYRRDRGGEMLDKDPFNAYWSAFYAGDAKHYFCSPTGIYVKASRL